MQNFKNFNLLICDRWTYFRNTKMFYVYKFLIKLVQHKSSRLDVFIFKALNKSPFFSYNWQIGFSETSSLIKENCTPISYKYVLFLQDSFFCKASAVCNRITLFSKFQKFTELGETFWVLLSAFSFASFRPFELFSVFV